MGAGLIVVLGKQGAGKGTQCARLALRYAIPHVATGDMLRAVVKSGSELGKEVRRLVEAGELVSDATITEVVAERLAEPDAALGAILDGYPRTQPQAEALDKIAGNGGIDCCVLLDVPTDVVIARLSARRVCEDCGAIYSAVPPPPPSTCTNCGGRVIQRADDRPEAIAHRLAAYERDTAPLLKHYSERGLLIKVDGIGDTDDVFERLCAVLDPGRR